MSHTFTVHIADDTTFPHGPIEATRKMQALVDENFTAGPNTVEWIQTVAVTA